MGEWPGECNIYSLLRLHERLLNSYSERYGTRKDVGRAVFKRDRDSGLREAAPGPRGPRDRAGSIFLSFSIGKWWLHKTAGSISTETVVVLKGVSLKWPGGRELE